MNTTTQRRLYMVPTAELICFVPTTPVAANKSWQWNRGTTEYKWDDNHWGLNFNQLNASVTGIAEWLDDNGENPDLK